MKRRSEVRMEGLGGLGIVIQGDGAGVPLVIPKEFPWLPRKTPGRDFASPSV